MIDRRKFLQQTGAAMVAAFSRNLDGIFHKNYGSGSGLIKNFDSKLIFVAGFSHETNTFHPVRTSTLFVGCAWTDAPDTWSRRHAD